MPTGPKAPKRPRDPDQLVKSIVALATGEAQDKKLQAPLHEERLDPSHH
jgi:hypothetical protein